MEGSAAEAGVTHEASPDDPGVPHTIRSLPPITLRLPLALRQALEAQAAQAGQSLNAYLTQVLTESVRLPLDAELRAWLHTWTQDGEDLGTVIAWLLTELWGLLEDRWPDRVLLWIPDECQPWLATQASRYQARRREQVLRRLLRRAAQGPSATATPQPHPPRRPPGPA
jgi:hypothetical protein